MGIMAFTPMGNTVSFNAAVTAPPAVQATSTTIGGTQYRVHNTGNVVVYMGVGATAAAANTSANTSLSGATISLMPNSVEVFTFNANQYFTGKTSSGTAVVTVLAGDGV
jgi:hypothetical protein